KKPRRSTAAKTTDRKLSAACANVLTTRVGAGGIFSSYSVCMLRYRHFWPIIKLLPPEFAHSAGLTLLRLPLRFAPKLLPDPFTWGGLAFRNRVGVAAGFDKNATCIRGVERLGAGFVEVGTILVSPWQGNLVSPRMKRLIDVRGIWNRLGFTS